MSEPSPRPPPLPSSAGPGPHPPRGHRVLLWVVLPLGIVVGLGALVMAAGWLYAYATVAVPIRPEDRAVLVDVQRLAAWAEMECPPTNGEVVVKKRYMDMAWELEYEFESQDEDGPFYVNCTVDLEPKLADAEMGYQAYWNGAQASLRLFGSNCRVVETNLFRWGDKSRCAVFVTDKGPVGHMVAGRKGRRVFFLMFVGAYTDEPDRLADLLQPVLRNVETYAP